MLDSRAIYINLMQHMGQVCYFLLRSSRFRTWLVPHQIGSGLEVTTSKNGAELHPLPQPDDISKVSHIQMAPSDPNVEASDRYKLVYKLVLCGETAP